MRTVATAEVAECLVSSQFPEWAGLPVRPVEHAGWDNTTFRLGDDLSVRMPTAEWYVEAVDKEHRWLPYLAPYLPLPIPTPVAKGSPGCGFPRPWSVYRWLPGAHATVDRVADPVAFALDLAAFLRALYAVPPGGGPPPGDHNFGRGASPGVYDEQTRAAIERLRGDVDTAAATEVWEAARVPFEGEPVWLHGDLGASNLLVSEGRLSAVIDFGTTAVGDPACDLVIAWTFLAGEAREAFREAVGLDAGAWARGRGWALWKALITQVGALDEGRADTAGLRFGWRQNARAVLDDVIADHAAYGR